MYPTHLVKIQLNTGIFPSKWAKGLITAMAKNSGLSDQLNGRPITQTPIFAKIFEKIVDRHVMNYLNDNNILSQYQYCFRAGKLTQQAIFRNGFL